MKARHHEKTYPKKLKNHRIMKKFPTNAYMLLASELILNKSRTDL